jgi:prefoldin alpha subunit
VLVPLTSSLYVAGVLDPKEKVLVDIGTSFFVGKSAGGAQELLANKAAQLKTNTDTLLKALTQKRGARWGSGGGRAGATRARARAHTRAHA